MFEFPDLGIVTIVQCRFGSKRLPGKCLKVIGKRPLLDHVLERAIAIGFPVWLATSENQKDDAVATLGSRAGVSVYRGSEWDVLGRMAEASRQASARIVVRVTGDCPLLCPDIAREVVALYCKTGGIATNDTTSSGWPDGLDVEVFPASYLYEAAERTIDKADREHVTPWIRRTAPHAVLRCAENWSKVKISVDHQDDLDRVRAIAALVHEPAAPWTALRSALVQWSRG